MAKGTIDQLNFEVILNDTRFDTQIRKDIALANQFNTSLTNAINLRNKMNASSATAVVNEQKIAREAAKTAAEKAKQALAEQKVRTEANKTALAEQKVRTEAERTKAAIERAAGSVTGGGRSLTRAWLRFSATMWSIISIIRIFTRTLGSAIKNISSFQQANANLATIMQKTRKEIEVLTNDALMLGRTTEWTASQVTELQTALAKLGYNIPQIRNMQDSVLQFATAVGAKLPDAANLAGAALRMFGMHSTETQKALEILTASTNKTALDFEKLKVALPYVGAIAHTIGFDIADTSALLGVLANSGLAASRTGTGLRQVLLRLSKENSALQEAMGGNIRTFDDFVNGLELLRDRSIGVGEAQKLVGDRTGAALLILANGVDDIRRLNEEIRNTDGLLKDIQAERLDTLHGSTLLLKSAWEGLIQTFRESAGPMKDIVDWLTKIVRMTSLAASRVNRVAQGTNGSFLWGTTGVVGSDALTKQFKEHFDNLVANGTPVEEAMKVVEQEMQGWMNGAQDDLITAMHKGYRETWLTRAVMNTWAGQLVIGRKMNQGREANEQIEAVENAMDNTRDYMVNWGSENAEMAAQAYLEHWKMVFDTEGAQAARSAADAIIKSFDGNEEMKKRLMEMKKQLNGYIGNGGMAGADALSADEKAAKEKKERDEEEIKSDRNKIARLEKIRDAYEKLEQAIGEKDAATWVLENMGQDVSKLDEEFEKIIAHLRTLGESGNEAADSIEARLGLDEASKVARTATAIKNVQKELDKWKKEWGGNYSGFDADLEKVYNKYVNENTKIEREYEDALKAAAIAYKDDADGLKKYCDELERYYQIRKDANFNSSQNAIDALVSKYVKNATSGMSLSDWGDKSLKQVYDIWKALSTMTNSALEGGLAVNENLVESIEKAGFSLEDFAKLSYDEFKKLSDEAKEELLKKLAKSIKEIGAACEEAASDVKEFAEASGDMNLAATIDNLANFSNLASSVVQNVAKGNLLGAAVSMFSWYTKRIFEAKTEAAKLAAALAEVSEEARRAQMESALALNTESIFGSNSMQGVRNAVKLIGDLEKSMSKYASEVSSKRFFGSRLGFFEWASEPNQKFHYTNLQEMAKSVGGDLYDAYGNLNADTLQDILDTYENLDAEQKKWIEQAIGDSEAYAKAMEQLDEAAKSLLDNVVSDVADKIVDSWWEAGRAALDYADILGDVAKAYAKLIVNDMLLQAAFDPDRQQAFIDALKGGDTAKAMSIVEGAMQSAVDMLPAIDSALQVLEPYRHPSGSSEDSSSSLGSGIKGITEDTAGLLASYINAIRADVSYIRVMQERGWEYITAFGQSLPTLNDHIAQISATNYDIAQSNQRILSELQSVIGAPGTSGMVVRVEAS